MKKIISAVVLAVVLIAGGLGGLVYAQEPANEVQAQCNTHYHYLVLEDTFENQQVEGKKDWTVMLHNWADETHDSVEAVTLTLDSEQEFDYIWPEENLEKTGPTTYEWSFGDVPEESGLEARVGSVPVTFSLGLSATRTVDQTEFSEPATQTLTITVTPEEDITNEQLVILVDAPDQTEASSVITEVTAEGIIQQSEHHVNIDLRNVPAGTTCTATIKIQVTPEVPVVEFIPQVAIIRIPFIPTTTISSSSVMLTSEIGPWTWRTDGNYEWEVNASEWIHRSLEWQPLCREIVEPIPHEPMTGQKLVSFGVHAEWSYPGETDVNHLSTGFIVTNPDGVSEITVERISVFAFDGTVVYEGPLRVKVDHDWEVYTGPLKPHETLQTGLEYYNLPELTREVEMIYTVEIFWTWTDKEGLALTGWATSSNVVRDAETDEAIEIIMWGTTQMVNMEQERKPEKMK